MKAACVLVCLALAHGITGSIFKHQERRVDGLDVQPLEYINKEQYQQQQDQLEGQKKWDQTLKSQEYPKQLQGQNQYDQQPKDNTYQVYQQEQELHYQQNLPTYQRYASLNPAEWRPIYKHPRHPHHPHHNNNHHERANRYVSPDGEYSQESQVPQQQMDNNNEKWTSPLFNSVMNKDNKVQAYGDVIMWNGLQMAVGPNSPVKTPEDIEMIFGDAQKAMRHIQDEEKAKFHEVYEITEQQNNEDAQLNATQLAEKHQYPIEEHTITTDDGYVLTVFRIPVKTQTRDVQKRPVVFLMHGILGSADDWLVMGPGKSLAYLLSDAGYDVWLGNARGNKYSKRHVSKHPAMSDFWHFSTDDIALHDLPAMIDFALETTNQEKLYYIGHAQGSTAFFALTATRPEYNDKIIMMYALSPMVYMTNVRSPLFRMMAPTSKFQHRLENQFGNGAFTPSKELIHTVGGNLCENEIGCKKVCSNVNFVMAGVNIDGMDANIIPVVMKHVPAGTSTKVIKQYGQGVASHEFQRYDYGTQMNELVYGQHMPPKYNISEVQVPVTLYYSEEDWLAHPKDVERLQKELPIVKEAYKVPEEHFSHLDFQFSAKAPEMVYQRLIESMQNNQ